MSVLLGSRERALRLYRHSLKTCLSWAIRREIFHEEALKIRAEFEQNSHLPNKAAAERIIKKGEQRLREYAHPDPYIVPYYPGGSLYARNPPMPAELHQQLDFGREDH